MKLKLEVNLPASPRNWNLVPTFTLHCRISPFSAAPLHHFHIFPPYLKPLGSTPRPPPLSPPLHRSNNQQILFQRLHTQPEEQDHRQAVSFLHSRFDAKTSPGIKIEITLDVANKSILKQNLDAIRVATEKHLSFIWTWYFIYLFLGRNVRSSALWLPLLFWNSTLLLCQVKVASPNCLIG